MTTLAQDLGGVVRLLEKATPGPWHYSEKGFSTKPTPMVYATGQDLNYIAMCRDFGNEGPTLNEENAQAIVAAVNFLRTHSAEIAGALEQLRDLHDSIRTVYDAVPALPITADTVDAATDALHAFCLMVGIHRVDVGDPQPPAMQASIDGTAGVEK